MKKLIWTGIALVALAGPGLAQAQTFSLPAALSTTSTSAAVTTKVDPACVISGTPRSIDVIVSENGGAVTGAVADEGGFVTIICNTPAGRISVGSNDMKNTTGAPILEATRFTDTIKFVGGAKPAASSAAGGWRLASRPTNSWGAWQNAMISQNTSNLRQIEVGITAFDFANVGLIPTAGDYVGKICITVDPSGAGGPSGFGTGTCS